MSPDVRADDVARPDRQAVTGAKDRRRKGGSRRGRGERAMVPDADFRSYYGKPILNKPTWSATDIAGYLFLGGLAGASSVLAAGADLTGRGKLASASKAGALVAIGGSLVALVHDLGKPSRFVNMLRVFKPSSPMSVGSWLLTGYAPLAGVAAVTSMTDWFPRLGRTATVGAALTGPAVAAYTAVLISDTAVPSWHDGFREMPFVFTGSAAVAAGGLGMLAAPTEEAGPARRAVVFGAALEISALRLMERRMGLTAEPLRTGNPGKLLRLAEVLAVGGALTGGLFGRRSRVAAVAGGAAALAGSACTRFAIFHAGVASAEDPKYTVVPQRDRLRDTSA
jgi:formate-dependent nitrite reductase membrane component NrfD